MLCARLQVCLTRVCTGTSRTTGLHLCPTGSSRASQRWHHCEFCVFFFITLKTKVCHLTWLVSYCNHEHVYMCWKLVIPYFVIHGRSWGGTNTFVCSPWLKTGLVPDKSVPRCVVSSLRLQSVKVLIRLTCLFLTATISTCKGVASVSYSICAVISFPTWEGTARCHPWWVHCFKRCVIKIILSLSLLNALFWVCMTESHQCRFRFGQNRI